ncbi:uncharacterized protein LOC120335420 [Styela clava]
MIGINCWFVMLTFLATSIAGPWIKVNKPFYELTFHNTASTWPQAKSFCENSRSSLVQLDVSSVKDDVYDTVRSSGAISTYWIGATDEAAEGVWKWIDGTPASIDWAPNEPGGGLEENYLVIENAEKLSDYPSNHKGGIICIKVKPPDMMLSETKLTVTLYKGEKEILCMVSGFPTTTVQWMKGKMTKPSIRSNKQSRVEQKLVLNLKQLTIADEGQYKCLASNTVGKTTTSISKTVDITVPSQPSILNITTSPCNSSLWITWKPHLRGIGIKHRFRIVDPSNSTNHIIFFTTPNKISITSIVASLQPSTPYFIKIDPCLTTATCFNHYATTRNATTGGLPGPVTKTSVEMTDDGCCNISWAIPMFSNSMYISDFKLVINSTRAKISPYNNHNYKIDEILLRSQITSYVIPKVFNRKYNVSIQAKSCAGFGPESGAVLECVTDTNVPSNLQAPATKDKVTNDGIVEISINAPDESNGPISCLFIVVQVNVKRRTLSVLNKERMNKLNNSQLEDEYIAIALNTTRARQDHSKLHLKLGDRVKTTCDISGQNNASSVTKNLYVAYNRRLALTETYSIFLVTSTPTKKNVLFGASEGLLIEKPYPDGE